MKRNTVSKGHIYKIRFAKMIRQIMKHGNGSSVFFQSVNLSSEIFESILQVFNIRSRLLFSWVLDWSSCCVCSRTERWHWTWTCRRNKGSSLGFQSATRRVPSSSTSFWNAANTMSVAESVKQSTNWVGLGEVCVQYSAISGKNCGGTGDANIATAISIGSVLIAEVTVYLGETRLSTWPERDCSSYC